MTAVLPTARATTGPPVEGLASAAAACRPAEAAASSTGIGSQHALLSMSAASVGVISYGASLVMAHLLPAGGYTAFAAVVAMLATVGIAAGALVPLPLAAAVRSHPAGSPERRAAVSFAVTVSLLAGSATAGVLAAVASTFARPAVVITAAAAGFAVFVIAPVWGVLQGEGRFAAYAAGAMGQVVIRVVAGVAAVAAGWGVGGALAGFLVGAAVVLAMGVRAVGSDLTWRPSVLLHRARWAETGPIAAVQVALSALAGIDVVLVAALTDPAGQAGGATAAAGYQVVAALTKAPLYVAAGAVVVSYPLLRAADQATRDRMLRAALSSFARLVVPATAILATAPAAVTALVLPAHLAASASLLPWLAVAGLGYATLTIALLVLLGIGARFRCLAALGPVALLLIAGVWLGWSYGGIDGVAVGASSGAAIAAGGVLLLAAPSLPRWPRREVIRAVVAMTALAAALVLARTVPALWVVLVGLIALHILGRIVAPSGRRAPLRAARLQILHLGFEDPAMPGAGGGSVRTHEINRRLAADHDVTVLTTRYPGCRDRVQDGVRYLHVGIGAGRTHLGRVLGYILVLPFHTRRRAADLVVEDFFAPISTMAAPLWTRRPTIGVVQWLNARQKARQYRLPVHLVEQFGVRRHHSLIAMSHDLDDQLHALNPAAHVEVIGNGVEPAAFATTHTLGEDIVFIGRLETAQKGVDLLLRAWAIAAPRCEATLVIAGTGPDEARLQQLATDLGVADRVRFIGWVSGAAKHALLARARLVVVPSRFETFGMVAAEALAAATPVVAFDIPCLREIVPPTCGRRVPAFDTAALADAIVDLYPDTPWLLAAGAAGREFAARFNWNHLAFRQAGVYLTVASAATPITASTGRTS